MIRFLLVWLAAGTLPLLGPVGTPESYHLCAALPALIMLAVACWPESTPTHYARDTWHDS